MDNNETKYKNPIAEQEHKVVPMPEDTPEFLKGDNWYGAEVEGDFLDFTERYTPPRYTLSRNGVKFANVGDLHIISGKPGNGKTGLMKMLMAAILSGGYGETLYAMNEERPHPVVLYIDTEQSKDDTIAVKNSVCVMAGRDYSKAYDDFRILRLRDTESELERWRKILKAIYLTRPTDIFLDGMLDLVRDYNDQVECQPIIRKSMMLATHYDASLWMVLHENPMVSKLVGTLGSIAQRKVAEIFSVIKIKQADQKPNEKAPEMPPIYFCVNQEKARGKDVERWYYAFTKDSGWGFPEEISRPTTIEDVLNPTPKYQEPSEEEILNAVSVIGSETMSFTKLREAVREKMHIGAPKAKEYIQIACTKGFLTISGNMYTANPTDRFAGPEYTMPF